MKRTRVLAASGFVISIAALAGLLIPVAVGAGRMKQHAAIRAVIPAADAMYDTAGLFVLVGSTVLLLVWLQQQAFRRLAISLPPNVITHVDDPAQPRSHPRDHLISLRIGGLYGP